MATSDLGPKNGDKAVCKWCGQDIVYSGILGRWVAMCNHSHMPVEDKKDEEPREAGDVVV